MGTNKILYQKQGAAYVRKAPKTGQTADHSSTSSATRTDGARPPPSAIDVASPSDQHQQNSITNSPPSDAETTAPLHSTPTAHKRQRLTPHPNIKVKSKKTSEASDSELSDLSATPPPPSPMLRAMKHLDRKVECSCECFCTCAKHAAYPHHAPLHLGQWALSTMNLPVSAVRPSSDLTSTTGLHDFEKIAFASQCTADLLRLLDPANRARKESEKEAQFLVRHINIVFPPSLELMDAETAIVRVNVALRAWRGDGLYEKLWTRFEQAVRGHPDLMFKFQGLMPVRWRRGDEVEVMKARRKALCAELEGGLGGKPGSIE